MDFEVCLAQVSQGRGAIGYIDASSQDLAARLAARYKELAAAGTAPAPSLLVAASPGVQARAQAQASALDASHLIEIVYQPDLRSDGKSLPEGFITAFDALAAEWAAGARIRAPGAQWQVMLPQPLLPAFMAQIKTLPEGAFLRGLAVYIINSLFTEAIKAALSELERAEKFARFIALQA
jgi:hypothetical protein